QGKEAFMSPVAPRCVVGTFVARPALPSVILYIAGIGLHPRVPHAPIIWSIAVIACAVAAILCFRLRYASSVFVAISLFLCGIAIAQVEAFYYPRDHIAAYATDQTRLAQLELQLDQEPRILADPF